MKIKRIYPKITWQELEALELIIKLFNDIECTGLGIDYRRFLTAADTSGIGSRGDRLIEERLFLSKIIKTMEENLHQADLDIECLSVFLEYIVLDKSIKQLGKEYDVKNIKDIVILLTQTIAIIIKKM